MKMFYEKDTNVDLIKDKKVAIFLFLIRFGSVSFS